MGTIAQKLQAIAASKVAIREAIENKGVGVKDAPLSEYAAKIAEIPSNLTDLGIDLEAIYDSFPEATPRIVVELWALSDTLTIPAVPGKLTRVVTSDGATYTTFPLTHKWDASKDVDSSIGLKMRWFVMFGVETFYDAPTIDRLHVCGACLKIRNPLAAFGYFYNSVYNIIDIRIHKESEISGTTAEMFQSLALVRNIPKINISQCDNANSMFKRCGSLETIPLLDFSGVNSMGSMFDGCSSLKYIPKIDTHNVSSMNSLFKDCTNLITIPELDMSSVTAMVFMFSGCRNLRYVPKMDTFKCKEFGKAFYDCRELVTIEEINMSSVFSEPIDMFYMCGNLRNIRFAGEIPVSINFNYCPLTVDSLVSIINALKNYTGSGARTLTLGSNIYKLSDSQKAIATNKNWILK